MEAIVLKSHTALTADRAWIRVTHAQFEVVNMTVQERKKAAAMGAKFEICGMGPLMGPNSHLAWMRPEVAGKLLMV